MINTSLEKLASKRANRVGKAYERQAIVTAACKTWATLAIWMLSCRHSTWQRSSECSSTTSHRMDRSPQIRSNCMRCSISSKNSLVNSFSSLNHTNLSILNLSCLSPFVAATCSKMQRSSAAFFSKCWQKNSREDIFKSYRNSSGRNWWRSFDARNAAPWRNRRKVFSISFSLLSRASRKFTFLASFKIISNLRSLPDKTE